MSTLNQTARQKCRIRKEVAHVKGTSLIDTDAMLLRIDSKSGHRGFLQHRAGHVVFEKAFMSCVK
jgi:hypothetical protein